MFSVVAETSGLWVASPRAKTLDDVVIDIDQFVFKNSRQFGALVVLSTCTNNSAKALLLQQNLSEEKYL